MSNLPVDNDDVVTIDTERHSPLALKDVYGINIPTPENRALKTITDVQTLMLLTFVAGRIVFEMPNLGCITHHSCTDCKKVITLKFTLAQFLEWQEGVVIQQCMPHLSANEREIIISGICGSCYDAMFERMEL